MQRLVIGGRKFKNVFKIFRLGMALFSPVFLCFGWLLHGGVQEFLSSLDFLFLYVDLCLPLDYLEVCNTFNGISIM